MTTGTAEVGAWNLLRNPKVKAFIESTLHGSWKLLHMDGEEAAARMAAIASADLADCTDAHGALLKPHDWPPAVRMAVESYDIAGKVKLASRLQALRTILELTGKVRSTADSIDDLAAAMRADREKHAKETP